MLPENVAFADLQAALNGVKSDIIQSIELFDVYRGVGLPENHKSMAVKIILQSMETTLTDEIVEPLIQQLIEEAEKVGAHLR